jgi:phosphotransacetylase
MNAVMVAKCLKVNQPKVGIVSAVEKVNPKIISTTDAIALKQQHQDSGDTSFLLDGPFAIDNLVSLDAVKHKGINSAVAGIADVLLFPELISANVFYKTSVFLANAIVAGIIVGATVPIILTSRADSALSKMYAILLAMVVSQCN